MIDSDKNAQTPELDASTQDGPDVDTPDVDAQSVEPPADAVGEEAWNQPVETGHGDILRIDVEGFEGPLDLLLMLARSQKLDILKISILDLADQYLDFITQMREMNLELAADYLVMASWLAYLKSRLLLPEDKDEDEPSGEELAAILAFRLQRLEAMRNVSATLMARNRLGRDIFTRGNPEIVVVTKTNEYRDNLYNLLEAYAQRRQRTVQVRMKVKRLPVMQVSAARKNLERILVESHDWIDLDTTLEQLPGANEMRNSAKASNLSASLEMVREGHAQLRQEKTFAPLFIKAKHRAA